MGSSLDTGRGLQKAKVPQKCPVVGIGASAGGLEAFTELLQKLPADTGMAFVLVQHLDPTHESQLTNLLARATALPVRQVQNNMSLAPNQVYVIPPNSQMTTKGGVLKLVEGRRTGEAHHSVDHFLESLALDRGLQAIGVILSGSASDGTLGLEAIKNEGGITFAQDDSAKYDSMPRSAIASGCVDYVLPPASIAEELGRIARLPQLLPQATQAAEELSKDAKDYKRILQLLRARTGADFNLYKPASIRRRINRRMVLNKTPRLSSYLKALRDHPGEVDALYQDVLINVTGFFRDSDAFEMLKQKAFPNILKDRRPDQPVRMWVLGCSTGQEAYSLAMAFLEFTAQSGLQIPLQVFGTDLNGTLLDKARAGLYSKSQVQELAPERLRRFFIQEDGGFRVCKPLRELCLFARHDVQSDPPFSRMDLLSCRNVMIYLEPVLQKRLLPIFHYSLQPEGYLLLGSSESIVGFTDLFSTEDKVHRLYSRKPASNRSRVRLQPKHGPIGRMTAPSANRPSVLGMAGEADAQNEADRVLLAKFAPAGVLVNEDMEILQFRGHTGPYLEPPVGRANYNLLKMVREGLLAPVQATIQKAKRGAETTRMEGVEFRYENQTRRVNLEIIPLKNSRERCFLLLFEPAPMGGSAHHKTEAPEAPPALPPDLAEALRENARLRSELAAAREYLQSVSEQYEATNEELQAANEETQSSNEELQTINEELESTKEEMQSTNEELTTVNEEMGNRNVELHRVNGDLSNVLIGVQMCIVVLGGDLCIRRFTPLAEKILNLLPTDVGRPILNIRSQFNLPDLEAVLHDVINAVRPYEREVQDKDGRWYSLRILPYKTLDQKIDGAVLLLVDVDALKRSEQLVKTALDYAEAVIETVREPMLVLDANFRIERGNRSFYRVFRVSPAETQGHLLHELGGGAWNIPDLRALLREVLTKNSVFNDFAVERDFERIGHRTILLNGRSIANHGGPPQRMLLAFDDVTESQQLIELQKSREELEKRVEERTAMLREMVQEMEAFSYSVSHDLRTPLRAMLGFVDLAIEEGGEGLSPAVKKHLQRVTAAADRADRLVQDLLTYSRVSRANLVLEPVDMGNVLQEVILLNPGFQAPQSDIQVRSPLPWVVGHKAALTQCVTNLLANATKFVLPGIIPCVKIWTEPVDGQVRFWFQDNGIGIEPANWTRIFGLFERVHSSQQYEGTGIGLAIVRKQIERMGGSVGVESEVGNGSKFWLQLKPASGL